MRKHKIISPLESLIFSMYSNKGSTALLLGSGLSTAAGIPTGWQIVLDMIKKLAVIQGKDCGGDPAKWYEENFGEQPRYSNLLEKLERSTAGRRSLIGSYIELSTDAERIKGAKQPTIAHKAIADLILKGYIKVVITTNFDRLLESSLAAIGIEPVIIYNKDTAQGATPLVHNKITIIKVNGDYCDTRIKNTDGELCAYDKPIKKIVKDVLENFGLLVCGWSADWDIALREIILGCINRRYSTYWLTKNDIREPSFARDLIQHRQGTIIDIEDANSCFKTIHEKILAIERFSTAHPLNKELAIAQVKQYLEEDADVSLHDLFLRETNRVIEGMIKIYTEHRDCSQKNYEEHISTLIKKYHTLSGNLCNMIAIGVYHGKEKHHLLWCEIIEKVVNFLPDEHIFGQQVLDYVEGLKFYCAILLLYTAGIVCVATKQFTLLNKIIKDIKYRDYQKGTIFLGAWLIPVKVMTPNNALCLPNSQIKDHSGKISHYKPLPFNQELHRVLKEPLSQIHYVGKQYDLFFNKFEIIYGVSYAQLNWKASGQPIPKTLIPVGLYMLDIENINSVWQEILREAEEQWGNWPPLKAGLFDGQYDVFSKLTKECVDTSQY